MLLFGKVYTQHSYRFLFPTAAPHHINILYIHNITSRAKTLWLTPQPLLRLVIISESESHDIPLLKTKLVNICTDRAYKWCWYLSIFCVNESFWSKCRYFGMPFVMFECIKRIMSWWMKHNHHLNTTCWIIWIGCEAPCNKVQNRYYSGHLQSTTCSAEK